MVSRKKYLEMKYFSVRDPLTLLWSDLIKAKLDHERSRGSFSVYILCFFLEFAAISCFDVDKIRTADIFKCFQLFFGPMNHRLCIMAHDSWDMVR